MIRKIVDSYKSQRWVGSDLPLLFFAIFFFLIPLITGLQHAEPMIGDEVTHYYMLQDTIESWPKPSFFARIPNGWDDQPELRCYPHPNGWHYLGAIFCRLAGNGFNQVQIYHSLYLLQLLIVVWVWTRRLAKKRKEAVWISVATVGSLPAIVLFSTTFYQDVPLTAMVLTAFFLLIERRRILLASLFMVIALWIKTSAIVFVPPFLVLTTISIWHGSEKSDTGNKNGSVIKRSIMALVSVAIIFGSLFHIQYILQKHTGANYYPVDRIIGFIKEINKSPSSKEAETVEPRNVVQTADEPNEEDPKLWDGKQEVIAHHPGDLRRPINFLLYGGIILWILFIMGIAGFCRQRIHRQTGIGNEGKFAMLIGTGLFYCIATAWHLRTAPDARFFIPAIPFFVIPLACWSTYIRRSKTIIAILCSIALLQAGAVVFKTHRMRRVSPAVMEAIEFLKNNPVEPARIFMYPEGNYRLFPVKHEWYLNYWLRDFWRADNDERIKALNEFGIGAIVIKKHLVAKADKEFSNLGTYPISFVNDIEQDPRFKKMLDNEEIAIYKVP